MPKLIKMEAFTDQTSAIVAAEYLARGYKLSDSVLQRAIEIDSEHIA